LEGQAVNVVPSDSVLTMGQSDSERRSVSRPNLTLTGKLFF